MYKSLKITTTTKIKLKGGGMKKLPTLSLVRVMRDNDNSKGMNSLKSYNFFIKGSRIKKFKKM